MAAIVGRDRRAATIYGEHRAMDVEYGGRGQGQVVARRQRDAADMDAGGLDPAIDGERAAIGGDHDGPGAHLVADGEVAGLDHEAARIEEAGGVQLLVEAGEIGEAGDAQIDAAGGEALPAGAGQAAGEIDGAAGAGCRGRDRPGLARRRDVDAGRDRLGDGPIGGLQHEIAAPAIFGDVEETHRPASEVDGGAPVEHDAIAGSDG